MDGERTSHENSSHRKDSKRNEQSKRTNLPELLLEPPERLYEHTNRTTKVQLVIDTEKWENLPRVQRE